MLVESPTPDGQGTFMLIAAPSFTSNYDHLNVFFPFSARARIAASARLVRALDPFGPLPPDSAALLDLCTQGVNASDLAQLHKLMVTAASSSGKYEDRVAGLATTYKAYMEFANWMAFGAHLTPLQGRLFSKDRVGVKDRLDQLCELHEQGGATQNDKGDRGYLSHDEGTSLMYLTLFCSFQKLSSSFLTAPEETPQGAPKDVYPQILRVEKLITLVAAARMSVDILALREHAMLLLSPAFTPFFEMFNPSVREEVTDYAKRVAALKVHPWLADAQALAQPVKRPTQWGKQNVTMGLAASKRPGALWDRMKGWQLARPDVATDMRDMMSDKTSSGFAMSFFEEAEALFLYRGMLNQSYLALAESVLGLTLPGAAPQVQLDGGSWHAVIMTGAESTEPIDVDTLLLRPRLPLFNAAGEAGQIMGGTTAFEYDAKTWMVGGSRHYAMNVLHRPSAIPPLYVNPHRPRITDGFGSGQMLPEMFVPVIDTEYFGDDDAAFTPYSVDGLAKAMGYADGEALLATKSMVSRLGNLFTHVSDAAGDRWEKVHPEATRLFHSTRTDQPWRRPVDVPVAIPSDTLAMDKVTAPISGPIQSTIIRDKQKPILTHSTLADADQMARAAILSLGFDRMDK